MAGSSCDTSGVWGGAWPHCSTWSEEGTPGSVKEVLRGAGTFLSCLTGQDILFFWLLLALAVIWRRCPSPRHYSFCLNPHLAVGWGLSEMERQAGRWEQMGG